MRHPIVPSKKHLHLDRSIHVVGGALMVVLAVGPVAGCSTTKEPGILAIVSAAPILTISEGTTVFVGPSSPVPVDPGLTLTGTDVVAGARVVISSGFVSGQDSLGFANQNGVTGSYSSGTGILTLSGSASTTVYQTALRSVTYANSAGALPNVSPRQIDFSVGTTLAFAGHYYEFVSGTVTWTAARAAGSARTLAGLQGYLVTVTSAAENTFIGGKLTAQGWMGASDAGVEGTWRWVTGPEGLEAAGLGRNFYTQCCGTVSGSYSAWAPGEPNNYGGNEDYGQFYTGATPSWNDLPDISLPGYVEEYGGMAGETQPQISGTKSLSVAAGCTLDSHCASTKFCDLASKTCLTKLAAGVAIPSDGLHDGTCTSGNASAVCTSGACNASTKTCATSNNVTCSTAAMCVSNICGSNNSCGAVVGNTGCTPATASAYCQSGRCSSSGVCIPSAAGSCYVDGDCNPGFFCRRDLYACQARLNVGVAIPQDGLHGGMCTFSVALAVCTSGACNATTFTCANVLGTTCGGAGDCVGNVCGSNGKCGYADGTGTCSAGTASVACQSATCSAGSVCMPGGAGRCWIDADCAGGEYCDRTNMLCETKLAPGVAIPDDGLHKADCSSALAVCATGLCNGSSATCAATNGSPCSAASYCEVDTCGNNHQCGIAIGDGPCTQANAGALCQSGKCSTAAVCQPAATGSCWVDADCSTNEYCDPLALACHAKLNAEGALPTDRLHDGVCSSGLATAICAGAACNPVTNTCASPAGAACTAASGCVVNVCNNTGACGYGPGEGTCQASNAAVRCASGICSNAGVCLSSASGNCWVDADCGPDTFCDRGTTSCIPRLTPGALLLVDAIHDGVCSPTLALAMCASGACNATSSTCSSAVGTSCSINDGCTNNVCGNNLVCGRTPGAGPCTAQNAIQVCQSGVCGPESLVCVPATAGGCGSDADCAVGEYCAGMTLTCTAHLATGGTLPSDGTHAACVNERNLACGTGLCNATTSTCAAANGTTCTDARTCVTNLCGRNGKCGLDDGQSGCTVPTASVCQTGVCTTAGVCGTLGCATDAACPTASAYCDASVGLCKAKLVVGQTLPTDSLHDGACNSSLSAVVCATGSCNSTTRACAFAKGQVCHVDGECAMNACGSDGLCALADGQAGCSTATAALCRSGLCSATGNRCVPTGAGRCAVDADCTGATFCAPATLSCVARLGNGVAIPRDGLHDDGCLPGNGATVCASGQCNAVTNTCSGAKGSTCTSASQCTIGACGANGMCGQVDGKGPCDATTAPALCQSGVCNVKLGLCKPTKTGSCLEDADCAADSFCAADTLTCTEKLAPGAPIPNDGAHAGVCSAAIAQGVCASGQCNASANTCAAPNGATCSTSAACVSAICPTDGICGKAIGGSCDRATDCRSGICTAAICTKAVIGSGATVDNGCGCEMGGGRDTGVLLFMAIAVARHIARRRRRP